MEKTVKEVEVIELTLRSRFTGEKCIVDCYGYEHLKFMVKEVIESTVSSWRVVLNNSYVEEAVEELRRDFNSGIIKK